MADDVLEAAGIPAEMVDFAAESGDEARLDEFKRFVEDVDPEDFQG